jgi:DNA repair exonuclease SbcCD ATPase subunit
MIDALDDVMEDVNDNLGKFSVPFTVSIGGDLEITVHNDDGTTEPARGKSGGEMVVLAICFRLAVSSHFAGDLGMMVLDEPTDNLDDIRMEHLARMLREVCTVAEKRGQQIIVITHDKRLVSAFNQTITL